MRRTRRITVGLIILLLCFTLFSALIAIPSSQAASPDELVAQLSSMERPDKGHPKLESVLWQVIAAGDVRQAAAFAQQSGIDLVDGVVRVIIEAAPGQAPAAASAAEGLGAKVETSYADWVQAVAPTSMLTALADIPSIDFIRLPRPPWPGVESEGLGPINVPEWQSAGFTGAGVKVGILDIGFSSHSGLLGTELPNTVNTYWAPSIGGAGTSPHGTACAEIIYDIAPDADFYLANFWTLPEFGNAVDWMIAQGVDIISLSVGTPAWGPGDGTGPVSEIIDNATSQGILWSIAAHNLAQSHWGGPWRDDEPDFLHNFAANDESNALYLYPGNGVFAVLRWDDPWGASSNDYDLYLLDSTFNAVAGSEGFQNGFQDPVEALSYVPPVAGIYHLVVAEFSSSRTIDFDLFAYQVPLQYQVAAGSLSVPADSLSAMTVGAVFWNDPNVIEVFSSQGPTEDGRTKPDLVAPDGVSTASYGASNGLPWTGGGTGFFGSSSSAPHAAGAAALVKERYPANTPAGIQGYLETNAIDLGDPGEDNIFGSGRLYLPPLGGGAQAIRTLPGAPVGLGDEFEVGMDVRDKGLFGKVGEMLPAGFTYVGSSLDPAQVAIDGQDVTFTLIGDIVFTYTVQAPSALGVYSFDGILKDVNRVGYLVTGDTQVTVGSWNPCLYDTEDSGGNDNGVIDLEEVVNAINDYFDDPNERALVRVADVINAFFDKTEC